MYPTPVKAHFERDCTEKCKSKQHGDDLNVCITKRCVSDADLCAYSRWKCSQCGQILDTMGRTVLHFAASCGRTQLTKWLVKNRGAAINAKDLESGYTALHRSVFYGKINTAVTLIQLGANINMVDNNDLNPLEHAMKDRISLADFTPDKPCQVYVWGTNTNYTLGTGTQHARQLPDLLDAFHKKYPNTYIKQVCLDKFHCVLVAKDGGVYTCGHGQGGRLGLNSENTVLIPQEVRFGMAAGQCFVQAAIGRDHSIFLSDSGQVWSCGLNTHHVLGIKPPPAQALVPKSLAEFRQPLVGICTGRFHSVAWGPTAVYTWGLHAGQLGHVSSQYTTYITPKMVANFANPDTKIVSVAASDGATVVATERGDIFVLHEYQCRKIASRQLNVDKVVVIGGHLNSKLSSDLLVEKGGKELKVLVLQKTGNLLLWQESHPQLSRCIYSLNRPLIVRDAVLSRTAVFFVTNDGEAFQGEFRPRKKKQQDSPQGGNVHKSPFHEFLDKDDCQMVRVVKFPHIHRAVSIECDFKGRNFAVLQTDPRFLLLDVPELSPTTIKDDLYTLLSDSDEMDSVHDVTFKISGYKYPVHRYIIAQKSEPLNSLIESSQPETTIDLTNINPTIFQEILVYIYTGTCDLLKPGKCSPEIQNLIEIGHAKADEKFSDIIFAENKTAFDDYYKKPKSNKAKAKVDIKDPVRLLQEAAKRFGLKLLYKQLDNFIYNDGYIQLKSKMKNVVEKVSFDRNSMKWLYDVVLKSKTGEIPVHRCILAGRLEYFNNLLALRWNEKSRRTVISLSISHVVLEQIIEFLYTDECKAIETSDDIDYISNVLIEADQLFIDRLKEICEVSLANLITLRNASQMLQFAAVYHAAQLKNCAMNFICLNLSAILESRILDILDAEVLDELTEYYCQWNPILSKRVITPFSNAPADEFVKNISESYPVRMDDLDVEGKKSMKNAKKPKVRNRKSSETKINNNNNNNNKQNDLNTEEEVYISETVKNDQKIDQKWTKILTEKEKHQKIVQTRLRAIAIAKEELDNEKLDTNLTKLVSSPKSIPHSPKPSESPQFNFDPIKSPASYEIPIQINQKLSQKQRKKLASQTIAQQLDQVNKKLSWNTVAASKDTNSFADMMKKDFPDLSGGASPKSPWQKLDIPDSPTASSSSQETKPSLMDIVADEKKQKENWNKMRDRPLLFTQMEDKAVRELERFYNIDQVTDEYITVHKVGKGAFALPKWVHSNTKH